MATPMGTANGVLIPSTTATASGNSPLLSNQAANPQNPAAVGLMLLVNVSAASGTSPTLALTVQVKDPASGNWIALGPAAPNLTAVSTQLIQVYPGDVSDTSITLIPVALPALPWRVAYTIGGTSPSFTFSVGYAYTF